MSKVRGFRAVLFLAITLLVGILGMEAATRLFSVLAGEFGQALAARDPSAILFMPHGKHGYKQKPGATQTYDNGTTAVWNTLGYRGPEVSLEKPTGVYRIVLLGGSTSHGFGVNNDETIDAHMRRILKEKYPGRQFEVVNLALGGYDSYQVAERMRMDGVPLDPDLVIINSGINDVRNAPFENIAPADPRTLLWEAHMSRMREEAARGGPTLWNRIKSYSYLARMPGLLRERLGTRSTMQTMRTLTPKPDAIEYFAANVRRTAEFADHVGASVLLSTPASSLRTKYKPSDMSDRGYWIIDGETTQVYRDQLANRMRDVAGALQSQGVKTRYVSHDLDADLFIDDCHLTGDGNEAVAANFVEAGKDFFATAPET